MKQETAYLKTNDLAKKIGVTPTTIFRAIRDGKLKATKTPGGHNRIERAEAERYMESLGIKVVF